MTASSQVNPIFPVDSGNKLIEGSAPLGSPLAVTYDATISSATSITLNAATTLVEVVAIDKGVFVRYAASASSTAYDLFVPVGQARRFKVPSGVTVISVIEEAATGKVSVTEF